MGNTRRELNTRLNAKIKSDLKKIKLTKGLFALFLRADQH